ncbi:MAG: prepilin-type N-terminal cleavage/methylation domain-containing protein [Gemmatimonadales bacterium]
MRNARRGFTIIELLAVITIIGILVTIAFPKVQATKMRAIKASMISDLRNLVSAQEAFFSTYADYAGSYTTGPEVAGSPLSSGVLSFRLSPGNVLTLTRKNPNSATGAGWTATVTNSGIVAAGFTTCGSYVGSPTYAPNAAVTREGSPACY